jgi:imidazole glycerol-phosphate synthase subunit HisF|tara:strand:- start:41 stop:871 length:831 start_codon:yes stop_codon:yes gene_type:complete
MYKRIISRLDIKNGILVKGIGLEGLRNLGDPSSFSKKFYLDNIDEIHFQDVVASLYNRNILYKVIEKNCKTIFVNLSIGGGIRSEQEIDNLLRLGADKVSINTAAIKNPKFLKEIVKIYGSSTINIAIETAKIGGKYEVLVETGRERTGISLFDWINKVQDSEVGEITVTDINYEGRNKGFNIELYKALREKVNVQLVAHGGAGKKEDVLELFNETDVDAVSISSMFHYNYLEKNIDSELSGSNFFLQTFSENDKIGFSILDLKKFLNKEGVKIRV